MSEVTSSAQTQIKTFIDDERKKMCYNLSDDDGGCGGKKKSWKLNWNGKRRENYEESIESSKVKSGITE